MQNGLCAQVRQCPRNSKWNEEHLCCECVNPKQYIINNSCQECPAGEQWDKASMSCVCENNLFRINGKCSECEINQVYNG
jgi:hypothetical protein